MEIKHSNWFAAGQEVQRALLLLSDGAFRLYFYLCFTANRSTGFAFRELPRLGSSVRKESAINCIVC